MYFSLIFFSPDSPLKQVPPRLPLWFRPLIANFLPIGGKRSSPWWIVGLRTYQCNPTTHKHTFLRWGLDMQWGIKMWHVHTYCIYTHTHTFVISHLTRAITVHTRVIYLNSDRCEGKTTNSKWLSPMQLKRMGTKRGGSSSWGAQQ